MFADRKVTAIATISYVLEGHTATTFLSLSVTQVSTFGSEHIKCKCVRLLRCPSTLKVSVGSQQQISQGLRSVSTDRNVKMYSLSYTSKEHPPMSHSEPMNRSRMASDVERLQNVFVISLFEKL